MAGAQRGLATEVSPGSGRRSRSPGATCARIPQNAPGFRGAATTQFDGNGGEIPQSKVNTLVRTCCKSHLCSGARMPTSANCPKNPGDARADVGIRAPILPLSQQPLVSVENGCAW